TDPCIGTAGGAAHPADGGRCHGRRAWVGALSSRRPSCSVTAPGGTLSPHETTRGGAMLKAIAGAHVRMLRAAGRVCRDEGGQGTVEYVGLAMAVGVLLLAVSSFVGGTDHGIGSVITSAIK